MFPNYSKIKNYFKVTDYFSSKNFLNFKKIKNKTNLSKINSKINLSKIEIQMDFFKIKKSPSFKILPKLRKAKKINISSKLKGLKMPINSQVPIPRHFKDSSPFSFILNNKLLFMFLFTIAYIIIYNFLFINTSFAADPKIVGKLNSAFENIEKWILRLATPAAAVAVGTGIFMKKFSFGDEERLRTGKKLIKNSLFSYAFILAIDLILQAIKSLIG